MLFSTVDDVHGSLGRLLQELTADPELGPRLSLLDTVVQLRLRLPDTKLTLAIRAHEAPSVSLGEQEEGAAAPEVVLTLDANVAHHLWLGHQNVAIGVARGAIQTKGDVRKIVDLLNLSGEIAPRYAQLLRAIGREDLLAPPAEEPEPAAADPATPAPSGDTSDADAPDVDASASDEALPSSDPDTPVPDPDAPPPGGEDTPPTDPDAPVPDPDAPTPAE